jgi:hypothetical protein
LAIVHQTLRKLMLCQLASKSITCDDDNSMSDFIVPNVPVSGGFANKTPQKTPKRTEVRQNISSSSPLQINGLAEISVGNEDATDFNCSICLKVCSSKNSLSHHMVAHKDLRRYKCTICGFRSNECGNIRRHTRNVHSSVESYSKLSQNDAAKTIVSYRQLREQKRMKAPTKRLGFVARRLAKARSVCRRSIAQCGSAAAASSKDCSAATDGDSCLPFSSPSTTDKSTVLLQGDRMKDTASGKCGAKERDADFTSTKSKFNFLKTKPRTLERCHSCGFRTKWKWSLYRHLKACQQRARLAKVKDCQELPEAVTNADANEKRRLIKSDSRSEKRRICRLGLGRYKCAHCSFRTDELSSYRDHLSACDVAAKSSKPSANETEQTLAVGEKTAKYMTRSRNSLPSATLHSHIATDLPDEVLQCKKKKDSTDSCQANGTNDRRPLTEFSRSCEGSNLRMYKCSYCNHKSKWPSEVRRHLQHCNPAAKLVDLSSVATNMLPANQRQFKCPFCNYTTMYRSDLYKHERRRHPNEKDVKQSIVDPTEVESLQSKIKNETNASGEETPKSSERDVGLTNSEDMWKLWRFTCSICNYRSNYRGNVCKHQRVHHRSKAAKVGILREEEARTTLESYLAGRRCNKEHGSQSAAGSSASSGVVAVARDSDSVGNQNRDTRWRSPRAGEMKADRIESTSPESVAEDDSKLMSFEELDKQANELNDEDAPVRRLRTPEKPAVLQHDGTTPLSHKTRAVVRGSAAPARCRADSNFNSRRGTAHVSNWSTWYSQMRKDALSNMRRFKCSECEFRSNWQSTVFKHRGRHHPNAKTIRLSSVEAVHNKCGAGLSEQHERDSYTHEAHLLLNTEQHETQVQDSAAKKQSVTPSKLQATPAKQSKAMSREKLDAQADLRRFKCSACSYRSNWTADAYRHRKRVHPDARIIQLSIAEASATRGSLLCRTKRHIKCTRCPYRAFSIMDMNRHNSQVHPSVAKKGSGSAPIGTNQWQSPVQTDAATITRRYTCSMCKFSSKWSANFYAHRNRFHPDAELVRVDVPEVKTAEGSRKTGKTSAPSQEQSVDVAGQSTVASVSTLHMSKVLSKSDRAVLQRYACPFCFLRSSHRHVIRRHLKRKHPGKVGVVKVLSNAVAESTLADYVRQHGSAKQRDSLTSALSDADRDVKPAASGTALPSNGDCASVKYQLPTQVSSREDDDSCASVGGGLRSPTAAEVEVVDDGCRSRSKPCSVREVWISCDHCPFLTKYRSNLVAHKQFHEPRTAATIRCDRCSFSVGDRKSLSKHRLVHRPEYAESRSTGLCRLALTRLRLSASAFVYACGSCPFMSKFPHTMTCHKQLHRQRDEASYKCNRCPMWSCDRSTIAKHAHVHRPGYVEKRVGNLCSSPLKSVAPPVEKMPDVEIEIGGEDDDEVVEMAAIKHKLVASRLNMTNCSLNRGLTAPPGSGSDVRNDALQTIDDNCRSVDFSASQNSSRRPSSVASSSVSDVGAHCPEKLRSWRCDKCPYSVRETERFKRHVSLHGRRLLYQCNYCNYSVLSYWRLAEHRRLHFAQNRNLLHAQSVSNLILLPARSRPPETVGNACSIGEGSEFFEDSDDFSVPPFPQFRCDRCPFASDQRSDFRRHVQCHMARSRLPCPFCDFSTSSFHLLPCHVLLHFNLPGCDTSAFAPNYRSMYPWKSVVADILSYLRKCSDKLHRRQQDVCASDAREGATAGSLLTGSDDDENLTSGSGCQASDDFRCKLPGATRDEYESNAGVRDSRDDERSEQRETKTFLNQDAATVELRPVKSEDSSVAECIVALPVDKSVVVCQYCDRLLYSLPQLAKHEAGHLIGHPL